MPAQPTIVTNIFIPVQVTRPASLLDSAADALIDDQRQTGRRELRGLAVADTIEALDGRVHVTLGLRYQTLDIANISYASGATLTRYKEERFTPAAALLVKPTSSLSVYGSYSQGLTPGPFAPGGTTNAGTAFAPFLSTQYEIGAKLDIGRWSGTLAAFRVNQPFGYVNAATNTFVLDGDVVNKGVEANISGQVVDGFTLLGGVAYFDATQRGTAGGVNDGRKATGVPEWQINLFGEWEPTFLKGFAVNGRVIYTDDQFYDAGNTRGIPDWTRVDLGARYAFNIGANKLALRAVIENVSDNNYWQSTARSFLTRGSPRTVRLTLDASF